MNEATFITFEGVTKTCNIPDDVILDYRNLISTARKELSVQDDYRIKAFNEGCEDSLNPSSDIQSGNKYFILFQQLNKQTTEELRTYILSDSVKSTGYYRIKKSNKTPSMIFNKTEELINSGACIESLYSTDSKSNYSNVGDIKWIMEYIIKSHDIKVLKLLLNNGLDINSQPIKLYFINSSFVKNDIIDLLISYKIDLRYHYDTQCDVSMKIFGYNHIFIARAISENMLELNTLIPPNNSPFFYYVNNLDEFLQNYNYLINMNLPAGDGNTLLSAGAVQHKVKLESKLNKYPQIDINLQYHIPKNKYTNPGDTLLHRLCRAKKLHINTIQLLLDRDVKLIKNDDGETQIDTLRKQEYTKSQRPILTILEKYFGVDITEKPINISYNITKYFEVVNDKKT